MKQFGSKLAPAREAFVKDDLDTAVRLFADGVGGPGTYERRSDAVRRMMEDNALAHKADATTRLPRPAFNCDMAKRIAMPVLLTGGERSPPFFGRILDELERCLPNRERVTIPASSHTVPDENAAAFNAAVLAFVAKN